MTTSGTTGGMPDAWRHDKRWSDQFLPEIKRICGEHLISEAPAEEDRSRNTDLMVLHMEPVRIACRVRRYNYFAAYRNDFTIRAARPEGRRTELAKILAGWGDYFIYAFAAPEGPKLHAWALTDLNVFRQWYAREREASGIAPGQPHLNRDGSAGFLAFSWTDLPRGFVVAAGVRNKD